MYMIQIQEDKAEELKEHAKKMLKHGKKLYECIEELCEESSLGERDGSGYYGNRYSNGGGSMGYRDEEDWERQQSMGFRRGVPGTGRYSRYR